MKKGRMCKQVASVADYHDPQAYDVFLSAIQKRFADETGPLFTTDAPPLFPAFLQALPEEARQHYTCNACRHFVERFGDLVKITPEGKKMSAIWDSTSVPELYRPSVSAMERIVARARVTGVFICDLTVWGQPVTGEWYHMSVVPRGELVFRRTTQTAHQASAEKKEDFKNLLAGLMEFPLSAINQAMSLLKTDSLYRSEKTIGVAEWLRDLHEKRSSTKNNEARTNMTWLAVATAPVGYCHVRSTMIGTLLEDIIAGLPFETIKTKFDAKMQPLQYQRPQAPPTAGNIAQAEKIVEQMGIKASLERRFARLDEIRTIWTPAHKKEESKEIGGVFSHLKPKDDAPSIPDLPAPAITMTWEKFARVVMPEAERIEFSVPRTAEYYGAMVTAVNPDAPPILQWDFADNRNPVSWYVYGSGSMPSRWGLTAGTFRPVTAIALQPSMWTAKDGHNGSAVFFILDGAKDIGPVSASLFPEILKAELHTVRATIEAYSKSAKLEGEEKASACGLRLQKGVAWNSLFRVWSRGIITDYKLDRWD
jgi:hypothetical protein